MNTGMGGHHSAQAGKHEWLTPPELIKALGEFDLDPCSPVNRPWPTAKNHFTIKDDGLSQPWIGRIWLNPPYGPFTGDWLERLADHGNGIALIFARTETDDWHQQVWKRAQAILFLHGRIYFHHVEGHQAQANAGAPSALIAYGQNNVTALQKSGLSGSLVTGWTVQ